MSNFDSDKYHYGAIVNSEGEVTEYAAGTVGTLKFSGGTHVTPMGNTQQEKVTDGATKIMDKLIPPATSSQTAETPKDKLIQLVNAAKTDSTYSSLSTDDDKMNAIKTAVSSGYTGVNLDQDLEDLIDEKKIILGGRKRRSMKNKKGSKKRGGKRKSRSKKSRSSKRRA